MAAITAGCGTRGPSGSGTDSAEARAAEQSVVAMFAALDKRDYEAAGALATADFELVEDTLILDMSGLVAFVRRYHERGLMIRRHFAHFRTEVNGPVAWTRYRQRGDLTMQGQSMRREWLESAVLLKDRGKWKIDRLQSINVESARER